MQQKTLSKNNKLTPAQARLARDRLISKLYRRGVSNKKIACTCRDKGFRASLATVKRTIQKLKDADQALAQEMSQAMLRARAKEDETARHFMSGVHVGQAMGFERYAGLNWRRPSPPPQRRDGEPYASYRSRLQRWRSLL